MRAQANVERTHPELMARTGRSGLPSWRHAIGVAALAIGIFASVTGCTKPPLAPPADPSTMQPTFLSILSDGISLEGSENRWDIPSGDPVAPPFVGNWPNGVPVAASGDLLEKFPKFQAAGAQRVRVKVPGRSKPLYGVLALLPVYETSTSSSARRTYRIAIPPERIEQALGGQVSVVYEPYPYTRQVILTNAQQEQYYADQTDEAPS